MKVEVTLTRKDLWRLYWFANLRAPINWLLYFPILIYFIWTTVKSLEFKYAILTAIMILITIVCFLAIAVIINTFIALFLVYTSSEKTGLGYHHFEIKEDGLLEITNLNEELIKWEGISRVYKKKDCIFIPKNRMLYHMLPSRDFESLQAFTDFFDVIKSKISG